MSSEKGSQELARLWMAAREHLKYQEDSVRSAEVALHNARNALGKSLMPEDAKVKESFSVWVRLENKKEIMVVATKEDMHDFSVEIRK